MREMLSKLLRRGHLEKEINYTFPTHILKVHNPEALRGFRPISLVGCVQIVAEDPNKLNEIGFCSHY